MSEVVLALSVLMIGMGIVKILIAVIVKIARRKEGN